MLAGKLFFLLGVFCFGSACAETLRINLSPWTSYCREPDPKNELHCDLPKGFEEGKKSYEFQVQGESAEGIALYEKSLSFGADAIVAKIKLFEIPKSVKHPRYFQLQFIWLEGNRGECQVSVSSEHQIWPPLTCVDFQKNKNKKFGVLVQVKKN